jgi:hypothetical protein
MRLSLLEVGLENTNTCHPNGEAKQLMRATRITARMVDET